MEPANRTRPKQGQERVLLIFPPFVLPWSPYLAPAQLKAYLEEKGVGADQVDANLAFFEHFLGRSHLEETRAVLSRRCEARSRAARCEAEAYLVLAELRGKTNAEYAARHIERAKATLRDSGSFYDPERYEWAIQVLDRALAALSSRWFPSELTTEGFRSSYSPFSVGDCLGFANDQEQNLFAPFYDRHLLPRLPLEDYSVVGISVAFPDQVLPAWSLAERIRAHRPRTFLVLGGNVFSRTGDALTGHPEAFDLVDAVVVGEGEVPLHALVRGRDRNRVDIPGVVSRSEGRVIYTPSKVTVRARDLPTPDFDGLDLDAYLSPEVVLPLLSFKGCSYGECTFCDHHVNYSGISGRPGAKVAADVRRLYESYGARRFTFVDEEMPPVHARNVARALDAVGDPKIRWMGYAIYRESWCREHWEELHRSGCREILFGFESASPRILAAMRKPLSLEWVRRITRDLDEVGIASRVNVIIGYPGETVEEAHQTLEFFLHERDLFAVPGTLVAFHPFLLVRNAPLLRTSLGRRIAEPNPEEPLRLHFDYDIGDAPELADQAGEGAELLDQEAAHQLAARCARRIATAYGPTHDPVWRVHRFLYTVERDLRPLRCRERTAPVQDRSLGEAKPIPLHLEQLGTAIIGFDLEAFQTRAEAHEARCDSARFWSNFRSKSAWVHQRLDRDGHSLRKAGRQVVVHMLLRGDSGRILDRLVPYGEATPGKAAPGEPAEA